MSQRSSESEPETSARPAPANAIGEERILDAAYELLLAIGMRRMADDEQLLMVAAAAPDPLVEDDLTSGLVDHLLPDLVALLGGLAGLGELPRQR